MRLLVIHNKSGKAFRVEIDIKEEDTFNDLIAKIRETPEHGNIDIQQLTLLVPKIPIPSSNFSEHVSKYLNIKENKLFLLKYGP